MTQQYGPNNRSPSLPGSNTGLGLQHKGAYLPELP